jgi:membrane protein required for colicin V production
LLASYAAVSGGVFLVAWAVRATLRQWKFEAFDRHLGMVLGGLEGALLGIVATLFVVSLSPSSRTPIFTSPSGRVVGRILDAVEPILPGEFRTELAAFWNDPDASARRPSAEPQRPVAEPVLKAPDVEQLKDLAKQGEQRLGRALTEVVEEGLDMSGQSPRYGGDVKRR